MARPKGIWTPDVVRKRIQTTKLVERLQDHALGKVEMTKTQVTAAQYLVSRSIPQAEAPKDINLNVSLENLVTASLAK